jgi:hypothetical protein
LSPEPNHSLGGFINPTKKHIFNIQPVKQTRWL